MNAQELKTHRMSVMRGDLAAHLRDDHGIVDIPKTKQAQIKLHDEQDHTGTVIPTSTNADRDAKVLAGVTRKPGEQPAANQPKPKPTARRKVEDVKPATPAKPTRRTSKPETPVQTAKRTARTAAKPASTVKPPARKPAAKPADEKVAGNGASPRENNQALAVALVDMVAEKFGHLPEADQQKMVNWLHALPTGGAGWERYWPTGLVRPNSSGWRKP